MGEYSTHTDATIDISTRAHSESQARGYLNILIIDEDRDCADALETLLEDMPGVGSVATASSASAALATLHDSRLAHLPDVIFIDPQTRVDRVASTQATFRELRRRLPQAAIVLLNVYPCGITRSLRGLVDYALRKDTSYRELHDLIDAVTAYSTGAAVCPAAG